MSQEDKIVHDNSIAVFIPSLFRAPRLEKTIQSIRDTSEVNIYCIVREDDRDARILLDKLSVEYWIDGTFVKDTRFVTRIQYLFEHTSEPWFLTGADDIIFHPGWLDEARKFMDRYSVISFDDMCNPALPGTNFLISRAYINLVGGTFDIQPGQVFGPYQHNFCDNELVMAAQKLDKFVQCEGKIQHFHPAHGGADWDAVYQWAVDRFNEDGALFNQRVHHLF